MPSTKHADHLNALSSMHKHCSAIDPATSQRILLRRQIESLSSSVGGVITKTNVLLQTNSLGVVTGAISAIVIYEAASQTSSAPRVDNSASAAARLSSQLASLSSVLTSSTADPNVANSIASAESVLRASTTASIPSTLSTVSSLTLSTAPSSASGSGGSSSPSTGLIAGAVIGSVAVVALIGIFVLLFLRHQRSNNAKTSETEQIEKPELEGAGMSHVKHEVGEVEKPELATKANAWELQGNEPLMGSGNARGGTGPWELPGHTGQMQDSLTAIQR